MTWLRLLFVLLPALCSGCSALSSVDSRSSARVFRVASIVELDLAGTNGYELHSLSRADVSRRYIAREQLETYFRILFSKYDIRSSKIRYAITLYSADGRALHDLHVRRMEDEQIAPIVALARRYNCDVCVFHPNQANFGTDDAYHEVYPSKPRSTH